MNTNLCHIAVVENACDEKDNVVNHVTVCDVVEEGGQGLDSLVAQVLELADKSLFQFCVNGGHGKWAGLIGQEVAVLGCCQMQLQVYGHPKNIERAREREEEGGGGRWREAEEGKEKGREKVGRGERE